MYKLIDDEIKKGLNKEVPYLPIVSPRLSTYIAVPKATAILFGGTSGSGKTAICDTTFLLEPFDYLRENNLPINIEWIYRSMERPTKYKLGKWLCYKLFKDYGILMDVPTLYQWPNANYKLTDELKDCFKTYKDYFDELMEYVTIIDGPENPTGVFKTAWNYMRERGKLEKVDEYNEVYVPNDPKKIVVQITDHVGKLLTEKKDGVALHDKGILDLHSSYSKNYLRDKFEMVVIDVSQLNRNVSDNLRNIKTELDIKDSDFQGSSVLYHDSDLVFGLLNPYKFKEFDYMGYKIKNFVTNKNYNRFRAMKILKNSYGADDIFLPYNFIGESGVMRELNRPDDMTDILYAKSRLAYHPNTKASINTFNLDKTDYVKYYEIFQ